VNTVRLNKIEIYESHINLIKDAKALAVFVHILKDEANLPRGSSCDFEGISLTEAEVADALDYLVDLNILTRHYGS